MTQTIEQLQAKVAELEAENARLRTVPMKYRRMQFNAQLQDENKELRAQLVAAQEEIERLNGQISVYRLSFVELERQRDVEMTSATRWATGYHELRDQLAKAEQRVAEYNELIYAVQTKNPDETRHQTALRYIRNAENRQSYTAANGASS